MRIQKFKEFSKINEDTEFNLQRLNSDTNNVAVFSVDNPTLSQNGYDKHQSAVAMATARVNDIMYKLSRTGALSNLRSRIALEDQDITSIKILRIIKNGVTYDAYITFIIDEYEYWGVIYDLIGQNTEFKSEVFKDTDLLQSKEWVVKIRGTILKEVLNWLRPKNGSYKLINDKVTCYSKETGSMLVMDKDIIIDVIRSYKGEITVKYKNDYYVLVKDNFIYFNWWFEQVNVDK